MQEKIENPELQAPEKKRNEGWLLELLDWLRLLAVVLSIIVLLFTFVVGIIGVDGSSMYPTLEDRDIMLVQRIGYAPQGGDVIVLRKDNAFGNRALVKRVIATGGQTVFIDYDNNTITVDGYELDEAYINYEIDGFYGEDVMAERIDLNPEYVNTEFVVPEGSVFVCGDNRNHSSDSRVAELGMVDERYVIGKVMLVLFPVRNFGLIK